MIDDNKPKIIVLMGFTNLYRRREPGYHNRKPKSHRCHTEEDSPVAWFPPSLEAPREADGAEDLFLCVGIEDKGN